MSSWGNDEIVKEEDSLTFEALHGAEFLEKVRAAHKALEGNVIAACLEECNTRCNSATDESVAQTLTQEQFNFPFEIVLTNVEKIQKGNLKSIGKKLRKGWVPTFEWSEDNLHAQHSTLEYAQVYVEAIVTGTMASHITRHTKGHPRFTVESHRPDWTGKPRPGAGTFRGIYMMFSPYSFIEVFRQRLCNLADPNARIFFERLCREMEKSDDPFLSALGRYAMPDCMYRGGICHMHKRNWEDCRMLPHWRDV